MTNKLLLAFFLFPAFQLHAQTDSARTLKTDWTKIDLSNRANDHFMIQYGFDGWVNTPDSISTSGFSRHFNFYFMYDYPFKTNPRYSIGIGAGLGSSNIFFQNTNIDLKSTSALLPFTNVAKQNHFDKYKLTTLFLEAPVELRFAQNPVTPDKGFKAAIGLKIGTLLKSYTKGKNLVDSSSKTIYGRNYIAKEVNKRFLNTTRLAVTGRVGYGNISLDGSYQFTGILRQGAGPAMNAWSIGLTLSGL